MAQGRSLEGSGPRLIAISFRGAFSESVGLKLPACFLHSGDKAGAGHLTELNSGDAELAHISFGTARDLASVVEADSGSVSRELLQLGESIIVDVAVCISQRGLLEGSLTLGVFGYHLLALHLAGFH